MNILTLHHASVTLHGRGVSHTAVRDVCLTLRQGQHTALLGPNGAGKSTLLQLMHGEAWADNKGGDYPVTWYLLPAATRKACGEHSPLVGRSLSALVSAAQHENYIRQAWDLHGEDLLLTGFEDSPLLYTLPAPQQTQAVRELARKLHVEHLLTRGITTLSQGQLRLLLLARALVRRPALLLLDECLDGLDAPNRQNVLRVLDDIRNTCTIVLTSHRAHYLPPWMERRLYMQNGQLFDQAPTPPPLPTKSDCPATAVPFRTGAMSGATPAATDKTRQPLVQLTNVTVYVQRAPVVHAVNWRIQLGEHWLLRGANGSGKSTLLRLLAGDEYPADGGSIERHLPRCMGHEGCISELEYIRRGIRLVSDALQAGYDYEVSAEELVLSGFDGSIGIYREFSPEEYREALYWLRRVGMEAHAKRSIRTLSTGQTRKLFLARALVGHPDMLLLDEPCSGLDTHSRQAILDILDSLAPDGIHTVLVSHHGEDRLKACNREASMVNGRLQIQE